MESGDASVYDLLTALSEKFAAKQHKLPVADFTKKLRSKCYEVLLFNNNSEGTTCRELQIDCPFTQCQF